MKARLTNRITGYDGVQRATLTCGGCGHERLWIWKVGSHPGLCFGCRETLDLSVADKGVRDLEGRVDVLERELLRLLAEVTDAIEAYADDHNSDRPTDVTVLLPRLRRALGR